MENNVVTVQYMNARGLGVIVDSGRSVPVPGSISGERIRVELRQCDPYRVRGYLVDIIEPSVDRIDPGCSHFPVCPGCQLRHMSRDAQRKFAIDRLIRRANKRKVLADHISKAEFAAIPCDRHYRIRCRVTPFRSARSVMLGMKPIFPDKPFIDMSACPNHHPDLNDLIVRVKDYLNRDQTGIDMSHSTREIHFALSAEGPHHIQFVVIAKNNQLNVWKTHLKDHLVSDDLTVFLLPLKTWKTGIEFKTPDAIGTSSYLRIQTATGVFAIHPTVWTPVSKYSVDSLVNSLIGDMTRSESRSVLELGCGAGFLSIPVARVVSEHVGVDKNRFAVESARLNASRFGVTHAAFRTGDATHAAGRLLQAEGRFDTVVLHGMRKPFGSRIFDLINALGSRSLYLISPSFGAWYADLGDAVDKGWQVDIIRLIDQIPHTAGFLAYAGLRKERIT